MIDVRLDGNYMRTKEESHRYLKKMMAFPEYYGANLDALFDMLTEIGRPTKIEIENADQMSQEIRDVFFDAAEENDNVILTIFFEK